MSFALTTPPSDRPPRQWWRHDYYRNSQSRCVEVLYSTTKAQSEAIAQQFADEPVLGFDMEWPLDADRRPRLQDKIALIQLASERKIALFHLSQHEGTTVDDFMAPTLKAILESPKIIKAGVAVINADFRRLRDNFNLEPKGAFELSHLHNLVRFGATTPRQATTKLCALSKLVELHLGLPLEKGSARTSDWSKRLSYTQTQYAATDAYAGFMLFHCLNAKRLAMDPAPPLPVFAETYRAPGLHRSSSALQLESITEGGEVRIFGVEDFFRMRRAERDQAITGESVGAEGGNTHINPTITNNEERPTPRRNAKAARVNIPIIMDASCRALYDRLASHRRQLAFSQDIRPFVIGGNKLLQALAFHRPSNEEELLLVPGVGSVKAAQYGPSWLEIIANFQAEQRAEGGDHNNIEQDVGDQEGGGDTHLEANGHDWKRRRIVGVGGSSENLIPPGGTPAVLTPQPEKQAISKPDSDFDFGFDLDAGDHDSVFGPPIELPSPATLKRKRDMIAPTAPTPQRNPSAPIAQMSIDIPEPRTPVRIRPPRMHIPATEPRSQQPALVASISARTPPPISSLTSTGSRRGAPASISTPTRPPISSLTSTGLRPGAPALISTPTRPPTSNLKPTASRSGASALLGNLSREKVILHNKLRAYVNGVVYEMHPKPIEPLVSEATLQYLITTVPRTIDEFRSTPGIQALVNACEVFNMDIWRTFEKWTRNPDVVPGAGSSR
ncbi:hypothetical protein F5B17DRAFT_398704 [Nemania serpens]|nr:hypothetical protein F5B17DRAFT_398704 [Nemania serpens]